MTKRPGGRGGSGSSREEGPPSRRGAKGRRPSTGRGKARERGRAPARASTPRPRGPRPLVVVFARSPEPGRVKTRLTPALRPEEAADLHRALLLDTVEVAETAEAEVVVAFTPATARRPLERLLGRRRRLLAQPPGDLGDRLEGVLGDLSREGRPVVVVGSDCPGLTPERVREAVGALDRVPAVLGPALDGGFYLIGMARAAPGLLRGIPWSTDRVFDIVRGRFLEAGLEVFVLAAERDLDTPEDLFEWFAVARESNRETAYPRSWKILHSLMSPRRLVELQARLPESP